MTPIQNQSLLGSRTQHPNSKMDFSCWSPAAHPRLPGGQIPGPDRSLTTRTHHKQWSAFTQKHVHMGCLIAQISCENSVPNSCWAHNQKSIYNTMYQQAMGQPLIWCIWMAGVFGLPCLSRRQKNHGEWRSEWALTVLLMGRAKDASWKRSEEAGLAAGKHWGK